METTFVRLESLTYFSLTPNTYYLLPNASLLFGSGYAGLVFSETNLEYNFSLRRRVLARKSFFCFSTKELSWNFNKAVGIMSYQSFNDNFFSSYPVQ